MGVYALGVLHTDGDEIAATAAALSGTSHEALLGLLDPAVVVVWEERVVVRLEKALVSDPGHDACIDSRAGKAPAGSADICRGGIPLLVLVNDTTTQNRSAGKAL